MLLYGAGEFSMNKEDVIWRVGSPDSDRLLVPSSLRQVVMSTIHDIHSSGHQEVQRTRAKAREMFYLWKMGTDIKTNVLTCDACCRNNRGPLPSRWP